MADPCWSFKDELKISDVKRGASSQYSVLDIEEIKKLEVAKIAADNAVLALWVPSSLLQEGLDTMKAWGFRQTQTHIWVKIKNQPFTEVVKQLKVMYNKNNLLPVDNLAIIKFVIHSLLDVFKFFNFDSMLAFGMGRIFRQTHEICLLGVKGKVYDVLKNKSQRSVHFDINRKHSAKPEILQDRLELMYPNALNGKALELFARRQRSEWLCIGNESPMTYNEDIRLSIEKLINANDNDMIPINKIISCYEEGTSKKLSEIWSLLSTNK